jgi:outer membrane protein assembly factor BamA/autotransporter translocation and assembly factor TamB
VTRPRDHHLSRRQRSRRVVLGLGALILAAATALFALGVFPQQRLRGLVESRLQEAIGPQSRIGNLHVVPARLQAEITNAMIVGPGYRIEVPRARLRLAPSALLRGVLVLRALEANGPTIEITRAEAPQNEDATVGTVPIVESLRIVDGSLLYHDDALGDLTLEGIEAQGALGVGALDVTARRGEWQKASPLPLTALAARLSLGQDRDLRLHRLDAGTPRSRVHLSGDVGRLSEPLLDLEFAATLDASDAELLGGSPKAHGTVRVSGRADGSLPSVRVEARAEAGRLVIGTEEVRDLEIQARHDAAADTSRLDVDLRVRQGQIRVGAERKSDLAGTVRVETWAKLIGQDPWRGAVRGEVRGEGWLQHERRRSQLTWRLVLDRAIAATGARGLRQARLEAEGTAGVFPLTIEGRARGHLNLLGTTGSVEVPVTASFTGGDGRLRADLEAIGEGGSLRASLAATAEAVERLELEAQGIDLSPLLPRGQGRMDAQADLRGAPDRLSGTVRVELGELTVAGADLGNLEGGLELREGAGSLKLVAPSLGAQGDGSVRLGATGGLQASIRLVDTPLETLGPLLSLPAAIPAWEGRASAVVTLEVPFAEPTAATAELQVDSFHLESGRFVARAAPFTVGLTRDFIALRDLELDLTGARVTASGHMRRPLGAIEGSLSFEGDLGSLPLPAPWELTGRASGRVLLAGRGDRPSLSGALELEEMGVARVSNDPFLLVTRARLDLAGDRLSVQDWTSRLAGGTLNLQGDVPLAPLLGATPASVDRRTDVESARVEADWQDVDTGRLLTALGAPRAERLRASLAGRLRLTGRPGSPEEATGRLDLDAISGEAAGIPFDVEPVAITLEGGIATLPELKLRSAGETLRAKGRIELARQDLEASASGRIDLRALSSVLHPVSLEGAAEIVLEASGTLAAPRGRGSLVLHDVAVRSPEIPQAMSGLQARLEIEDRQLTLTDMRASLGGGTIEASGKARPDLSETDLTLTVRDVALRYPADFKSWLDADLRLQGSASAPRLEGEVRLQRGLFDTDIFLDDVLLKPRTPTEVAPSPLLRRVALDVAVAVERPVRVRNNLADLAIRGEMRVRGDLAEPLPYGRLEVVPGGVVYLQTRKFTVENGRLSFDGTLEPDISLRAETMIREPSSGDVQVTLAAEGPAYRPQLTLTSDPSFSERELASLIATGRRGVDLASSGWVAGEQTAALLAGRLTRNVSKELLALGLDEVEIQPELLARETDPGARFTFGKQLSSRMKLVYSFGLNDPEQTFYQAEYRFRARMDAIARVQRDDEGANTYGLGQRLRWGAPRKRREGGSGGRTEIRAVEWKGESPLPEPVLRDLTKAKAGDVVLPWDLQADAERIERALVSRDHLEAMVLARLRDGVAEFDIRPGPRFHWEVEGFTAPADLGKAIREARFENDALAAGRKRLLDAAHKQGYPRAAVETRVEERGDERVLRFRVNPGPPAAATQVRFEGAAAVQEKRLLEVAGGAGELLNAPEAARERILAEYRRLHYLTAEVDDPLVSGDLSLLIILVPVREGPRARLASVSFTGTSRPEPELRDAARLAPGTPYDEEAVRTAIIGLREYYLSRGHGDMRLASRLEPTGPDWELVFEISEGEARVVGPIVVSGLRRTRESAVRSRLDLRAGDPLDPRKLVVVERRLMQLQVFSRVSVTADQESPSTVHVEVEERGPYSLAYDARFSADDRATLVIDAEVGNLGGRAMALGARHRQGRTLRETRGSLTVPALGRARGLTVSAFQREEDFLLLREDTPGALLETFKDTEIQRGIQVQQSMQLPNAWGLLYGYGFRRVASRATEFTQDVSALELSLLRDTRNDALDARKGRFWSLSFELAPKQLGSDIAYFRVYAQAFLTRPIGRSLTWVQGYRLGLSNGLNEKKLDEVRLFGRSTALFQAGGGHSLRGYATDSVGPPGIVAGVSAGGEAVAIVNQELRYHHPSGLGGVVFYDGGNVFPQIRDLSLDFRHSLGVGLRYASPIGLLRIDLGFPLNRRSGDRPYQWFFSLGQAF